MTGLSDDDLHRAYRYALSLAGDRDQSFELVHAALEQWLSGSRHGIERPLAYLFTCIRNRFVDERRRLTKFSHEPHDEDSPGSVSLSEFESLMVDADQVRWLLTHLRSEEREVLYLWAVEGYTFEQITELTSVPRGTLLARLHRLRQKLQRLDTTELDARRGRAG